MNIHSEPPGIPKRNIAENTFATTIVIKLKDKDKLNIV